MGATCRRRLTSRRRERTEFARDERDERKKVEKCLRRKTCLMKTKRNISTRELIKCSQARDLRRRLHAKPFPIAEMSDLKKRFRGDSKEDRYVRSKSMFAGNTRY